MYLTYHTPLTYIHTHTHSHTRTHKPSLAWARLYSLDDFDLDYSTVLYHRHVLMN